jgi:hypothetical protein
MEVGTRFAGQEFVDLLAEEKHVVTISDDGRAEFTVGPGTIAVWVLKSSLER